MPKNPFKVGDVVRFKNIPENGECHSIARSEPGTYFRVSKIWGESIRIAYMNGEPVGVGLDREEGGQPYFAWRFEKDPFTMAVLEAIGEAEANV